MVRGAVGCNDVKRRPREPDTMKAMTDPTDTLRCKRCRREATPDDLDGLLWCDECVDVERGRARWWGRGLGVAATALLALWIAAAIRPGPDFLLLWGLVIGVALALLARLGEELWLGVTRLLNRPAARASSSAHGGPEQDGVGEEP